ncbi:MAG: RNA methyltransferase [Bacteroidota bacterium]
MTQIDNKKLSLTELDRLSPSAFKSQQKLPIIIVLDNIRSLYNIGSVFRSADAFLIEAVYLCGITAQPPHREIQKTALGATETVRWQYFDNTHEAIKSLQQNHFTIYSVEQTTNSILLQNITINTNDKIALVFGNEVNGVDQDIINQSNAVIEIPQFGSKHSFNIAVSAGIVMWEVYKKLKIN